MLKKIRNVFIFRLSKFPVFKRKLLQFVDHYHKYAPLIVGNLTRNPAHLKHLFSTKVIAKPGILGFKGGAYNPGALALNDNTILLLAKSQILPWFEARGKNQNFYMKGNPVAFFLDKDSVETKKSFVVTNLIGFPNAEDYEIEDLRLFKWKGKIMVNHSLVTKGKVDGFINQKEVRSALSVFDEKEKTLQFCTVPKVDFPVQHFEKNWVYKENGNQLLLFYFLNPYKVLELEDEESFTFKTVIDQQLSIKIEDPGGFGTMVSLSTNPIDFDENYWMVVIHQIKHKFTGRCYYHWAVLIDKFTFLPVKITSKPIFSGMGARGRTPGIRYISSILKVENKILFFAGEGDVFVTVTKRTVKEIASLFVPL